MREDGRAVTKGALRGARNVELPRAGLSDPGGTFHAVRDGVRAMERAGRIERRGGFNGGRVLWDAKRGEFVRV